MIQRTRHIDRVHRLLGTNPVVALLGARQVGKTTLARQVAEDRDATWFDLEDRSDLARLEEPKLALQDLDGLVVLDEVQNLPEVFSTLRVLVDRPESTTRFLILGSAGPQLLRQSQTLAGRIGFHDLEGFDLDELGEGQVTVRWVRGGFPRAILADDEVSQDWREAFIRTYLERDLPRLGISIAAPTMRRFWTMLAHWHGQVWNSSALARNFGVSDKTVQRYLDILQATYVVRSLEPWHENLRKRQVKRPKVYVRDSGLLHSLLGIGTLGELTAHPKLGASWEGLGIGQVVARLNARPRECFFWATHGGAELDLLVVRGDRRLGFEFKRTAAPRKTKSMTIAMEDLRLDSIDVIHAGDATFPLAERIRAVPMARVWSDLDPL